MVFFYKKKDKGMKLAGKELQLMSILLDNAVSYSPEGGCITIEAGIVAKRFTLSVANFGEPISEKDRRRIFERFFRKDEARQESGNQFGL